jgi:uncharacterized protein YaaN involved in tellurite resistance
MVEKILNQLANCSEEELNLISKKAYAIMLNRLHEKIEELKENFFKAWKELEKMGVDIYSKEDGLLHLNDITFEY